MCTDEVMKQSILLLHGFTCSSKSFFFPSLKKRYGKKYTVFVPDLPSPMHPDIDEWTEVIAHLPEKSFSIIIAHSLGGTFALSLLSRGIIHCNFLVMIGSSPGPKLHPLLHTFLKYPIDFPSIMSGVQKIVTIQSLDDPWTFPEYGILNIRYTKGKGYGMIYADKGHFETEDLPEEVLRTIDALL